ncbi:MAG TPA: TonB-dependent receptor plug domain-containing protein [Xanthobacteraceae bacterium]|nr:TonB-dependent receptor plug domain-containing protein [Xanthobacteraceae bacterium]
MSIHSVTRHLLRSGLAAGALIAALGLAHAQTVLPELTVVSPSLVPIEASKTGSSVTAMSGDEARASGFSQLSDVMRTFPGMHVSQSGSRGSLTQFRVRGAEANHLLVMIDGVPANANSDGAYNFADIPLDDIERVELLRGPQSGLYGANAHSGVLTIVTKSGRGQKPEFTARIEGGTQRSAEGAMSARGSAGPVYGSITTSYATTDGFNIARNGAETDGAKRLAVTGKAGIDFSPNFNVEGFVRHARRKAEFDPQDPFFLNTGLVEDAPGYSTNLAETLARGEATLKLFDERWIQSVKWTSTRQDLSALEGFVRSSGSVGSTETLSYKSALILDSMFAGGERHRLTGLVEDRREKFSFDSIFVFGPDLDAARNGYKRTSTGVGGEYVLDLLATGTTISAAVRQDFNEPFKDELTWRLSLSQKVAPIGGRLHASVGRAVTNPSFLEQFGFVTSTFVPNPSLVPESSIGWDAGWEQTLWNGRVVFDVTYFNSRLENEIVLISLPSFRSSVRNMTGTSTREGVETTLKVRPFDWLTVSGTYTYTDARDDQGVPEIRRPKHAASGTVTASFAEGRGKATLNVVYNGKMTDTIFTFPSSTTTLAAYTLVGGMISYDTTPWSTIYLRAENVFDRRYEEVYSFRSPGAAVYAGLKVRTN